MIKIKTDFNKRFTTVVTLALIMACDWAKDSEHDRGIKSFVAISPLFLAALVALLMSVVVSESLAQSHDTISIWDASTIPALVTENDPSAVELGVKFRASVDGSIVGIRFYKGPQNTGTHVGKLWSASGTLLATATFTGETASGWQE